MTDRAALGLLTRSEAEERAGRGGADGRRLDWGPDRERGCCLRVSGRTPDAFTAALYGYLALTPARLIGVNLAEAAGETRSQNMPGTSTEYPNWKLPLCGPAGEPVLLEELASSERVAPGGAGRRRARCLSSAVAGRVAPTSPPATAGDG